MNITKSSIFHRRTNDSGNRKKKNNERSEMTEKTGMSEQSTNVVALHTNRRSTAVKLTDSKQLVKWTLRNNIISNSLSGATQLLLLAHTPVSRKGTAVVVVVVVLVVLVGGGWLMAFLCVMSKL